MNNDLAQTIAAIIDPVAWDRVGQVGPGRRALKPSDRTEKMDKTRREGSLRKARKVIEAFEAHFLDPDGAGDLSWNVIANLRWLANNHGLRGHMPCGMLPGAFLLIVAKRLEASSKRMTAPGREQD